MRHRSLSFRPGPLIRPTICYVAGLLSVGQINIDIQIIYLILVFLVFVLLISFVRSLSIVFGFSFLLICSILGHLQLHHLNDSCHSSFFSQLENQDMIFYAVISDKLNYSANSKRVKVPLKIKTIHMAHDTTALKREVKLNVIAFIELTDIRHHRLTIGDKLMLSGSLRSISKNPNPYSFDYKRYMFNKGFTHFLYVNDTDLIAKNTFSIRAYFNRLQQNLVSILNVNIKNPDAFTIAAAMVLGHKDDLSDNIQNIYRQTGAAHIIAVSGLHIDIITFILLILLGKNRISNRYLKTCQYAVLLLLVWSYALLVGSTASVVRAATMFTLYIAALTLSKRAHVWNILSVTALIMLVYNPRYIFDVSFQFSFIGVISIVYFFPKFRFLNTFKLKALRWWFDALLVSLTVQILIAPISIYYFNYFPVAFLLSNSIVILFIYLIIGGTCTVILSSYLFQPMTYYLASALESIITCLNALLIQINQIQLTGLENIYLNQSDLVIIYGYIGLLLFVINKITLDRITLLIVILFLHMGYSTLVQSSEKNKPHFIIYYCPNNTLIDFIYQDICYSYSSNGNTYPYHTDNYRIAHGIGDVVELCDSYYEDTYIRLSGQVIEFFEFKLLLDYKEQVDNVEDFDLIIVKANYLPTNLPDKRTILNTTMEQKHPQIHNSYVDGALITTLN